MSNRIHEKQGRPKRFTARVGLSLEPIERMFVEYYADMYHKDFAQIVRGMIRKYIAIDPNFDIKKFSRWAEKMCIQDQDDEETQALYKQALREFNEASSAAGVSGIKKKKIS